MGATVLKSNMSIDEINSTAQARLAARREANKDREQYLYGKPKVLMHRRSFVMTLPVDDKPRYVYK